MAGDRMPNRKVPEAIVTPQHRLALRDLKDAMEKLLGKDLIQLKLFGSRARGDADADSDLDVVLIAGNLTRKRRREILDQVADIELEHLTPISLLLISQEDFRRLLSRERRIAVDIEREGVPI